MPKTILCKNGYLLVKKKHTSSEIKKIKEELTVKPLEMGGYGAESNEFPVYLETEKRICVPRYYGIKHFGKAEKEVTYKPTKIKSKFNANLRDYQQKIWDILKTGFANEGGGILSIPPGRGKTIIALYVACALGLKTLVIVHKTFLLDQWVERINQFTNMKTGRIIQNKIDTFGKDIVIGMLQSISMKDYDGDIFSDFGLVIIDECHHIGSEVFSRALPKIAAKYMLGLSATPDRKDGLTKVFTWHLGPILYRESGHVNTQLEVRYYAYDSKDKKYNDKYMNMYDRRKREYMKKPNIAGTVNNIVEVNARNKTIVNIVKEIFEEEDERKIIILSDRLAHLDKLKEMIEKEKIVISPDGKEHEVTLGYYVGGMKKKALVESESKDVILGTYGMSSEGLDIPALNTLIMATSRSSIEQSVGRIQRKLSHEATVHPIVVDIADNLASFRTQQYSRKRFYKSKKYLVNYYSVEEDKIREVNVRKPGQAEEEENSDSDVESEGTTGFIDTETESDTESETDSETDSD